MDESRDAASLGIPGEALLQPVLDRLHVVVGLGLDRLHLRGVLLGELLDEALEMLFRVFRERLDLRNPRIASESEEPPDLDRDPVPEESGFAEAVAQRLELLVVASVQRR